MATIDPWPPAAWGPKLYQFDSAGRHVAVDLPGVGPVAAPTADERQVSGPAIPDIGATTDASVAQDATPGAWADGEPVSPTVARVRYGAAEAQSQRTGNPDPGSH